MSSCFVRSCVAALMGCVAVFCDVSWSWAQPVPSATIEGGQDRLQAPRSSVTVKLRRAPNLSDAPLTATKPTSTPVTRPPAAPVAAVTQVESVADAAVVLHAGKLPTRVAASQTEVELKVGDILVTRSGSSPELLGRAQLAGATPMRLPYEMHFMGEDGELRHCQLFAEIAGGGLRVARDGQSFGTQLFVGLRDRESWKREYSLPHPIQLLVTASVDRVVPALLSIAATNRATEVNLEAHDPGAEVNVRVSAADEGLNLRVPVMRPRLLLTVNPEFIQGFGLETASVLIKAEGLPNPKGRAVVLTSSRGRLDGAGLTLDEQGFASTEVRSVGVGSWVLEARGAPWVPARRELHFEWPVRFFLCALLGGALGSGISVIRSQHEILRSRWMLRHFAAGQLLGVLVAVAYAVGVNLFSVELPRFGGEAFVFALAALGALGLASKLPWVAPEEIAPASL